MHLSSNRTEMVMKSLTVFKVDRDTVLSIPSLNYANATAGDHEPFIVQNAIY